MSGLQPTVVITTKNRRDDLCKCIASALCRTPRPQVLVIDDGSIDGTFDLVNREFPQVQIKRSKTSLGLVAQPNRAARMMETPILLSIDDDAAFSTPTVMSTALREFDHPRVGAVAIPVADVKLFVGNLSGPWITGVYNQPRSGNAVNYTSNDSTHPTLAGHWYLAYRLADVIGSELPELIPSNIAH